MNEVRKNLWRSLQRKLEKDCANEMPFWTQILLGRFTFARILFFASVLELAGVY